MYVLHTFWVWISTTGRLKINVGHCDLYFMVKWLCLIPCRLIHVWTSLFGIMNQYDPTHDLKLNVGHHDPYFTVQWFCLISWRLFDVYTSYFRSMIQYDPTFDLKINVGHCDLYFMVQWLCLLPWRLFHVGTSLFGIMNQYDPKHDLNINVITMTYISWSNDFMLYLEDYLMYEHHAWGLWVSMTGRLTSK